MAHKLKCVIHMPVTRKNVPRPVITSDQKYGFDYLFLIIPILYVVFFLATVRCKAGVSVNKIRIEQRTTELGHISIQRGNMNCMRDAVA